MGSRASNNGLKSESGAIVAIYYGNQSALARLMLVEAL
jgi:hypothetical protein